MQLYVDIFWLALMKMTEHTICSYLFKYLHSGQDLISNTHQNSETKSKLREIFIWTF